ncbi:uncharacterized protein DS421_18g604230 [Arachis hypogaea]|nr:uncharacterized protein DS421_18g604230 [Arachis hypogaea]
MDWPGRGYLNGFHNIASMIFHQSTLNSQVKSIMMDTLLLWKTEQDYRIYCMPTSATGDFTQNLCSFLHRS